jgi:hypothetical protein
MNPFKGRFASPNLSQRYRHRGMKNIRDVSPDGGLSHGRPALRPKENEPSIDRHVQSFFERTEHSLSRWYFWPRSETITCWRSTEISNVAGSNVLPGESQWLSWTGARQIA